MKVNKLELVNVLNLVRPALAKKENIEIMTHFIFTGTDVVTYNDRVCIHHPYEVETPFSVKADLFSKIVGSLDGEEVEMEIEGNTLKFKTEFSKGKFSTNVNNEVSDKIKLLAEEFTKYEWDKLPADFGSAIHLLQFSADKDRTQTTSCIKFDGENAFCGHEARIAWYKFDDSPFKDKSFLVDAQSMHELTDFSTVVDICITEKWVHFADKKDVIYSIRKKDGDFLDIEKVFLQFKGTTLLFPDTIREAVEFASIMVSDQNIQDRTILLDFQLDKLIISGEYEGGIAGVERECENPNEGMTDPIKLRMNPMFLGDITSKGLGREKVSYTDRGVMFEIDKFKHILSLVG